METAVASSLSTNFLPACSSRGVTASSCASSPLNSISVKTVKFRTKKTVTTASTRGYGSGMLELSRKRLAAIALTAALQFAPALTVQATEFNLLNDGPPTESHVADDAGVVNRVTKSDLISLLTDLENRKGFHIDVVTLRKLTSKPDVFEFADQLLEKWYPSVEEGNKKGLVLLVTAQKEGAVTGGPEFIKAVGDKVLEGVVAENLPVLATDEKYNEALYSSTKRLVAAIDGLEDVAGPRFQENKRESNFKSREETEEKRGQFTTVVGGLLVIAFVVPMVQYYAYVSKK